MKKVFSRQDDVINKCISQSQDSARTSDCRISFEGDYIYAGYRNSIHRHSIKDRILGKRLKNDLFLVSRYRSYIDGHKIYGITYALGQASKRYYTIKSFENQNENAEDYKRLIKKRKNSIMRSIRHLNWRVEQFKKIVREYNRYIKEFNLRLIKIDENSMDDKVHIRRVSLRLRGKL